MIGLLVMWDHSRGVGILRVAGAVCSWWPNIDITDTVDLEEALVFSRVYFFR